jgi:hypothetical protein
MKASLKVYGLTKSEAVSLENKNFIVKWLRKNIAIISSRKRSYGFNIPTEIIGKRMQPNIQCEEFGETPGFTTIVCGLSGKPLFPYKIIGQRESGITAKFSAPVTAIVIDGNAFGWVILTQYEIKTRKGMVCLDRENVFAGTLRDIESNFPRFAEAAFAAINKARRLEVTGHQDARSVWAASKATC